ncbi:MAG: hypothetical protein H6Q14_2935 [Bacteroidetes bacterium]|nr:hypothetical protein [Bacteroidota bacterium]
MVFCVFALRQANISMEFIIQILMLFTVLNCILKLSFWKWWQSALFGLICAGFVFLTKQYAILQSKTQLVDYLTNKTALENMAVLLTIESAICFGFCVAALRNLFGKKKQKKLLPLYWYPSLMVFPVLFYVLTQTIFNMPGTDFNQISIILAAAVFLVFPLAGEGFKWLFPEHESRLEVHFLVSLFVCVLGLLATVNGNVTYAAVKEPINWMALGFSFGLFLVTFLLGYAWSKLKWLLSKKRK